ncbi:MAG: DUF4397 domain-containing protein [Gemmatimonadaceae bacterium]|nr:DUF4397 domain-containing protein [Gemmatimonadaceae bacterium]
MTSYRALAALFGAMLLGACDKNAVQDIAGPPLATSIRFFNFGVGAPAVNFYANTTKMTAISSATGVESTNGVAYGSVGSGGYYATIAPGTYAITGRIAATTDKDLAIATLNANLAAGKQYSFFMSGIYSATAKSVDGFVVEDPVPATIDYSVATVRFVNAISNSSAMTLYARHQTTGQEVAIGAAVAYKAGGAFVNVPNGLYDLAVRVTGSTSNAIVRTGVSFSAGRVYTIGARGDMTVTSTTSGNRPQLDNTANR